MKKIIFGIAIILVSAIQSCVTTKDVTGKYSSRYYEHFLKLDSDSTFQYEFRSFHMYAQSSGKWLRVGKKALVLNSNITTTIVPMKIAVLDNASYNSLSINVNTVDSLKSENYRCQIYLNNTLYAVIRADSLSEFKLAHSPRNIYLKFTFDPIVSVSNLISPPVATEKHTLGIAKAPRSIKLTLDLPASFFYYRPFNQEVLKIKRRSVAFYNSFKKRWEYVPTVPDSVNIFMRD